MIHQNLFPDKVNWQWFLPIFQSTKFLWVMRYFFSTAVEYYLRQKAVKVQIQN